MILVQNSHWLGMGNLDCGQDELTD